MEKKIILITGTSSGFGWLTARTCADLGHKVYATMRNIKSKNADKAKSLSLHPNIEVLNVDVTVSDSVLAAATSVINKENRIDVLVNNAGVYATGISETFTEHDLERVMDVNVKGSWRMIKAVLPQMRKQGDGLIINISSVAGRFSAPFMSMYNSSKFALEGLTEALHFELKPLGLDVVMVQPGAFPTEIFEKILSGSDIEVIKHYGELAKIPEQLGQGVAQMFETIRPNPQLIADSIVDLINTPRGKRPLRTVADVATGNLVETANSKVKEQYINFLTAFGMQDMLS